MTIDIKKLAKEAGGTIGFIGGELAHESNRTYIFTKDELKQFAEAYTAKVLEDKERETAELKAELADAKDDIVLHRYRSAQLSQEITRLKDLLEKNKAFAENDKGFVLKITELQAHINDLREALLSTQDALSQIVHHGTEQ